MEVRRGEIYYADLSPVVGSEQGGVRPVLVIQNVELACGSSGLARDSVALLEQIRTIDKRRLKSRVGEVPHGVMQSVDRAILVSLGFVK
mgnify:CR=1 FL=1